METRTSLSGTVLCILPGAQGALRLGKSWIQAYLGAICALRSSTRHSSFRAPMRVLSRMTILARRDAQFRRKDRREYSATQKEKAGEDSRNEGPMCSWCTLKRTYVSQLVPEKSTWGARGTRGSISRPAASDLNNSKRACVDPDQRGGNIQY